MAWTLLLGFVALTLVFVWMLLVRYRIGVLEDWLGTGELDVALRERQAEGAPGRSDDGRRPPDGRYVVAGYAIVLAILFLYAVQLVLAPPPADPGRGPGGRPPARRRRSAVRRPTGDHRTVPSPRRGTPTVTRAPAAAGSAPTAAAGSPPPATAAARRPRTGRRVRYAVVGLVLVGAFGFLVVKGLGTALNFYLTGRPGRGPAGHPRDQDLQPRGRGRAGLDPRHRRSASTSWSPPAPARVAVQNTGSPPELFQAEHPGDRRRPLRRPDSSSPTRSWSSTRRPTSPPTPAGSPRPTGPSDDRRTAPRACAPAGR